MATFVLTDCSVKLTLPPTKVWVQFTTNDNKTIVHYLDTLDKFESLDVCKKCAYDCTSWHVMEDNVRDKNTVVTLCTGQRSRRPKITITRDCLDKLHDEINIYNQ